MQTEEEILKIKKVKNTAVRTVVLRHLLSLEKAQSLKDIEKKNYIYSNFPKMDPKLYVKVKKPKIKYQSRFEVAKDEVKNLYKT